MSSFRMTGSAGSHETVTRCYDSPSSPYRDGPYSHTAPDRTEEPLSHVNHKDHDADYSREKKELSDAIKALAKTC